VADAKAATKTLLVISCDEAGLTQGGTRRIIHALPARIVNGQVECWTGAWIRSIGNLGDKEYLRVLRNEAPSVWRSYQGGEYPWEQYVDSALRTAITNRAWSTPVQVVGAVTMVPLAAVTKPNQQPDPLAGGS
jgi:hypothetical protein